jgi:hypothetical protein
MIQRTFLLFIGLICFFSFSNTQVHGQGRVTYSEFRKEFKTPPDKAKPMVYHWWLGGYVDTTRLREELESMKEAGISGFTIFEIGSRDTNFVRSGPAFMGDKSLETIKFAVEEAGKLGLEVGLNTASSWNAGGSWIKPKYAAKSIYRSKKKIKGGSQQSVKLPFPDIPEKDSWGNPSMIEFDPDGRPVFYKEVAVLAIPANHEGTYLDTSKIINVSRYYDTDTEQLTWDVPSGKWEIVRYVCSNSGENLVLPSENSAGPILDHFDAASTEYHFNYMINKLESVLGDLEETALTNLYMASYEAKGFTWTTTLPTEFKRINGYAVEKFIPVLFDENIFSSELADNFRQDFQRTLSELMINNFYKKSKEICNAHGLENNAEAGSPGLPLHNVPVEPLKALGSIDRPRGEFWINHGSFNKKGIDILRVVKEVSSASHIYDRDIVEEEAFTSFQHWQIGPYGMKPMGDRAFCEGMNKVVVHGSTHNPSYTGNPGIVYHAGTHYNDKRVWWPKVRPFNEYLARISYIHQEAEFKADVLYYYGDTIPNYGGHKNSRFVAGAGYDYEIINTEILREIVVKDDKLVLPRTGAEFKMLALAGEHKFNPDVLLKLQELVDQGAVVIGSKPQRVATRKIEPDMPRVEGIIDNLWTEFSPGDLKRNKGKIYHGIEASRMLEHLNVVPDFNYDDKKLFTLDYIHYGRGDLDFYLVRNTTNKWISRDLSFRQQDKVPEIWDPVSGEIVEASIYKQDNHYIRLPLTLAPYGTKFIVFREGDSDSHYTRVKGSGEHPPLLQYEKGGINFWEEGAFELTGKDQRRPIDNEIGVQTLEGAWEVFFPEGRGAPEKVILPELKSWTESKHEGVKYFSGIARYEKDFVYTINSNTLEEPRIYLDLGDLSHIGEVWLNDEPLGITWTKPYRFDITDELKPGRNKLVIEIANTWSNRLTGDALTGEDYTSTNINSTDVEKGYFIDGPWSEVPLVESGLFGPVRILTVKPVN